MKQMRDDDLQANTSNNEAGILQETIAGGDASMERLANTFANSARRWEMIVYPSLFAFIVLASYGFYLIFSLTSDVASLARNVSVLTQSIDRMTVNMDNVSVNMNHISASMVSMDQKMNALEPMSINIEQMNHAARNMSHNAEGIHHQMGAMNRNIRPMGQMGSFMPW